MKKRSVKSLRQEANVLQLVATFTRAEMSAHECFKLVSEAFPALPGLVRIAEHIERVKGSFSVQGSLVPVFEASKGDVFCPFVCQALASGNQCGDEEDDFAKTACRCATLLLHRADLVESGYTPDFVERITFYQILGLLTGVGCSVLQALQTIQKMDMGTEVVNRMNHIVEQIRQGYIFADSGTPNPLDLNPLEALLLGVGEVSAEFSSMCWLLAEIEELHPATASLGKERILTDDEFSLFLAFQCLAVMLGAGMQLRKALSFLSVRLPDARAQEVFSVISGVVGKGVAFSKATESHPDFFPAWVIRFLLDNGNNRYGIVQDVTAIANFYRMRYVGSRVMQRLELN
jgi:hypothetical protein